MKNVLEYLEKSAALYPCHIAVIDEKGKCTYDELLIQSKRCGSGLCNQQRRPIGVFMEKSISTLVAFMGVVYSGNFYVLLNPSLPKERLRQMVDVLDHPLLITDDENEKKAHEIFYDEKIVKVEELLENEINEEKLKEIRKDSYDVDPLYVNFTSGSTGVPKGVIVAHRSVLDFIDEFTSLFNMTHEDIFGNQAPFDFDVSVKDIYSSMKMGATLVIIPKRLFSIPSKLLDFICEHEITTMIWAVSALCLISTFHGLDYKVPNKVNKILFSGEVMPMKHLKIWMEHLPQALFVNLYGPTEITCNCTYHVIDRNRCYEEGLPIGIAFPNEDVFLLDSQDKKVMDDSVGEICVRGSALSLGYYHSKEQTRKNFVENPLNPYYREIIYRTGDLGKKVNGEFYFCGRKDFQIKHMGHRIELEEIERAMNDIRLIERCCCIYDEQKNKIYGFYIGNIDKKEIIEDLKTKLPAYMIPNIWRKIDKMPMTKNGKIDRQELMKGSTNGK